MKTAYFLFLIFFVTHFDIHAQPTGDSQVEGTLTVGVPGIGNNLLLFNSERSWAFRQNGSGSTTALELISIGGGDKNFFINTTGNIGIPKFSNLNNRTRNLVVAPDGTLQVQDHSGFGGIYSINPHEFVSVNNHGDDQNYNLNLGVVYHENVASGPEALTAPIHLPNGAIIKQVNVFYRDNVMPDTLEIGIVIRNQLDPAGSSSFFIIGETLDSPNVQILSNNSIFIEIDNILNTYSIQVEEKIDGTDWPGSTVGISSVTIFYDIGS